MLNQLIEFSLKNRVIVLVLTALVIVWGVFTVRDTPIDAFPDLSENQVLVSADWMGRGPQEIQDQVTYPLETALRGLPNVKEVRSASSFGMSLITVIFEDGVEPYFARQVVNEKVQQAIPQLPRGVQPTLGPVSTPMGQVFMYTVESDRHNLADLRTVEDFTIKQQLSAVPGVAEVASIGGYVMQYQVNLDPQLMQSYRVTFNQVFGALGANNANIGAKVVEQNGQEFIIRGLGLIESIDDIKNIVITQNNNVPIYIKDVASVAAGPDFRRGVLTKSGYEAAGGIVIQRMGENTLNVIDQVKAKIAEIQPTLPEGMRIVPFYDQTDLVKKAVNTLTRALIEEFILVSIIVVLFLGNVRSSLIVTSAIPIGILIALIAMKQIHLSANLMSLGGIAIGIGVMTDAAIVMVENIFRHLAEDRGRRNIIEVTLEAAKEVAAPIFFSITIIIVTFLPVFTMTGTEGKMYTPMAWAKSFAMSGSLLLAFTLVPVLCTLLLKGKIQEKDTWIVAKMHQWYEPVLKAVMKYYKTTITAAIAVMIAGFSLLPLLGTTFMPALDEGTFLVMPTMLPSVSLSEALEAAKTMDKVIMDIPEVDMSVGKVGRAESAMDPAPISMIETIVTLKPKAEWRPGVTKDTIEQEMMARLANIPGLNLAFTQPIAGRLSMLTTGVRTELGIKLYGEDLAVLQQKAFDIEKALATVPGVSDLLAERVFGASYLEIQVNREKAARYGLNIADVEDAVELAVGGKSATTTIEGRKRFNVLVRYNRENRESIDAMQNILIPVTGSGAGVTANAGVGMGGMGGGGATAAAKPVSGAYIPLGEVAQFQVVDGPSMISSENGVYRMIVQMNTRGRDVVSFVNEANKVIKEKVDLPPGYSMKWTGQYENQQRAKDRLAIVVPAVVVLTFFLLYMSFKSVSDAFLILMNIPFSLVGGIVAMYLTNTYLTVAAAVGFIALFGIAVQNGVIMVTYIKHLRDQRSLEEAIMEGAFTRLRPVMITALVASLGLFPLIFATGTGAEVQRPMATVVVGGLVTSTILTLIVLPCIYLVWHRWLERKKPTVTGDFHTVE
ncbi:efflux RND transporter permease subunit [Propionispora vibrioides]|uniref:Cu(I)/Ag(I) efflux system membrane protein CusA/SilA n=1 Tax=Propionispora vibrioides TaxID=112903 RepID=A0A1H8X0I0_9FIRM|nr:CusA/CzcA family heavy metal efflux RND transporter [Propionispora vibrioides]SEP33369.1 Cu(I)/Ag(I) efflux system membrane protein CusA/SilA [Propionispora vibrioides]